MACDFFPSTVLFCQNKKILFDKILGNRILLSLLTVTLRNATCTIIFDQARILSLKRFTQRIVRNSQQTSDNGIWSAELVQLADISLIS